jgi:hypothetical protein
MTVKTPLLNMCDWCKHYQGATNNRVVCKAFPDGIPMEILDLGVTHRQPYSGDSGIRFEKEEDENLWSPRLKSSMEKSPYRADTLFQIVIDLTESTTPIDIRKYPKDKDAE